MNTQSAPSAVSRPGNLENPWLAAFLAEPWQEIVLAQVLIRRAGSGFELRHVDDASAKMLKPLPLSEIRALANFTETNEFRPLKSMPNLRRGWSLRANSPDELEFGLQQLYPGALPDWFAAHQQPPPVTNYRDFTNRQTGMYRVTTLLTDAEVSDVIDNVCSALCLKRRLWTVAEKPTDPPQTKSLIPCLEPCAILLESARKTARLRQSEDLGLPTPPNL